MNKFVQEKQEDFNKIIEHFKKEISALRTGRANPAVLENIVVEAYGIKNQLVNLASINVADSRSMTIAPWDKSIIKSVEKGIVEANMGLSVVNEGDKIRATVPMMTEENRKDLVKNLNERMEKARVSLKQVREEIKSAIEKASKEKEISEDDKFRFVKELDEETGKKNDEIKSIKDVKEKDIMTI